MSEKSPSAEEVVEQFWFAICLVLFVAIFACLAGCGNGSPGAMPIGLPSVPAREEKKVWYMETDFPGQILSADSLLASYEKNEADTDRQWIGQVIGITGRVRRVDTDADGNTLVLLAGSSSRKAPIHCRFHKLRLAFLSPLSIGQTVTVAGECKGLHPDLYVNDCTILYHK